MDKIKPLYTATATQGRAPQDEVLRKFKMRSVRAPWAPIRKYEQQRQA